MILQLDKPRRLFTGELLRQDMGLVPGFVSPTFLRPSSARPPAKRSLTPLFHTDSGPPIGEVALIPGVVILVAASFVPAGCGQENSDAPVVMCHRKYRCKKVLVFAVLFPVSRPSTATVRVAVFARTDALILHYPGTGQTIQPPVTGLLHCCEEVMAVGVPHGGQPWRWPSAGSF